MPDRKPKGKGKDNAKNQNADQRQSRAHGAVIDESFQEAPVEGVPEDEV